MILIYFFFLLILAILCFAAYRLETKLIDLEYELKHISNVIKINDDYTWDLLKDFAKHVDDFDKALKQISNEESIESADALENNNKQGTVC